jgi:DNA-binding beta-propeller fold protein YncE
VELLQYDSGAMKSEVTTSFGTEDEQLSYPRGVTFTLDGCYLLVVDSGNDRVSKFSATSGAFIAHVVTKPENGISNPWDVLQCEDGSIVVTQAFSGSGGSVVCVGADGLTAQEIIIPSTTGGAILTPYSPSYSASLNGVVVKTHEGAFLLRDAWFASSRHAWLSALSCS